MAAFLHEMALSYPLLLVVILFFLGSIGGAVLVFGLWLESLK